MRSMVWTSNLWREHLSYILKVMTMKWMSVYNHLLAFGALVKMSIGACKKENNVSHWKRHHHFYLAEEPQCVIKWPIKYILEVAKSLPNFLLTEESESWRVHTKYTTRTNMVVNHELYETSRVTLKQILSNFLPSLFHTPYKTWLNFLKVSVFMSWVLRANKHDFDVLENWFIWINV